jgi:hypothetical protein
MRRAQCIPIREDTTGYKNTLQLSACQIPDDGRVAMAANDDGKQAAPSPNHDEQLLFRALSWTKE